MSFGQEQPFLRELPMRQVLVPRCDRGGKPHVQSVGQDGVNLVHGKQMVHHQLHVWLPAPEFAKRVQHHPMPRKRRGNADAERTGLAKGDPLGASLRLIDVLQDTSRVAQKHFPRRAQSDSSGQSVVDELHRVWSASNAKLTSAPESKPWGLHEFTARGASSRPRLPSSLTD
jgi:hypothetical protein